MVVRAGGIGLLPQPTHPSLKVIFSPDGRPAVVLVTEGLDETSMTLNLRIATLGDVRTQTMRAFAASEMRKMLAPVR